MIFDHGTTYYSGYIIYPMVIFKSTIIHKARNFGAFRGMNTEISNT